MPTKKTAVKKIKATKPKVEIEPPTKKVKKTTLKKLPKEALEAPKGTLISAKRHYYGTGKRKRAIARVRIYPEGKGSILVNEKPLEEYMRIKTLIGSILAPLKITGFEKKFDATIKITGGGFRGQADAMRHGIARALLAYDPNLRLTLKRAGFLIRDARIKERKKYGLRRARRAPQFSKR